MIKLIKFNLGFIKYLTVETFKQKSFKGYILFLKNTFVKYFIELGKLLNHYKLLLNPEYQKQLKKYEQYKEVQKDLQKAIKLLKYIDNKMEKSGIPRYKRRQFWRDFHNDGQVRKEIFDNLVQELNQMK